MIRRTFTKLGSLKPTSAMLGVLLGSIGTATGVFSCIATQRNSARVTEIEAQAVFHEAARLLGVTIENPDEIGIILGDSEGDTQSAVQNAPRIQELIRKLAVLRPGSEEVDLLRLNLAVALSNFEAAENILTNARQLHDLEISDAEVMALLGSAAWTRFRLEVIADRYFSRAIDLAPNNVAILSGYALFLHGANRNQEASVLAMRTVDIDQSSVDFRNMLAHILIESDRIDEGINVLEKAISDGVADSSTYNHLAFTLDSRGRTSDALVAMHKAVELEPTNRPHQFNLAILLQKAGKPQEAAKVVERARRLPIQAGEPSPLQHEHSESSGASSD